MDDKQAILAEIVAEVKAEFQDWIEERDGGAVETPTQKAGAYFGIRKEAWDTALALVLHVAKRRYEKAGVVTQPVTQMSFEEWERGEIGEDPDPRFSGERKRGWNAALANVQQGGRFEVGDRAQNANGIHGDIVFIPDGDSYEFVHDPADVRPLPKTVDLTDDEKLQSIFACRVQRMPESIPETWKAIAHELATGKTLDQLCQQYGVATTKEVS